MEEQVGKRMAALGRRVLLVYGGGSIKRSGLYDTVLARLADAGVEVTGTRRRPTQSLASAWCGKGSVSAVKTGSTPFWRSEAAASSTPPKQSRSARVPTGTCGTFRTARSGGKKRCRSAVLTIPAAGSESSDSCVITKEEGPAQTLPVPERHSFPISPSSTRLLPAPCLPIRQPAALPTSSPTSWSGISPG